MPFQKVIYCKEKENKTFKQVHVITTKPMSVTLSDRMMVQNNYHTKVTQFRQASKGVFFHTATQDDH